MKVTGSIEESMIRRIEQLRRVMDRIEEKEDVPVLQLADAVQLVDERILLHPLDYENKVQWEVVKAHGTRKVGIHTELFPTMREGFVWAAYYLLAKPPRGHDNMFPYFDVVTQKVLEQVIAPKPGRVNRGLKKQPPRPGGHKRKPEQTRRELIG